MACDWKRKQPLLVPHGVHLKGENEKGEHCPDHSRHTSLGCYGAQNPPWHFHFEAWTERRRSCKCQRGRKKKMHGNLYPAVWKHKDMRQHWISAVCKSAIDAGWAARLVQRVKYTRVSFMKPKLNSWEILHCWLFAVSIKCSWTITC